MSWNYRILGVTVTTDMPGVEPTECYSIIEAYYDDNDRIEAYSAESMHPYGESPDELKADLEAMLRAFDLPILTEDDLPTGEPAS